MNEAQNEAQQVSIPEVVGFLEKLKTLLSSRRFWLYAARSAVALLVLVGMIAPLIGMEPPAEIPDEEALADRLLQAAQPVIALIGAVLVILGLLADGRGMSKDYTLRPPGAADRVGLKRLE